MKPITRLELVALLSGLSSATFISIVKATDPLTSGMKKTGNPYVTGKGADATSSIRQVGKVNGIANASYDNVVENRLRKTIAAERVAVSLPVLSDDEMRTEVNSRFSKGSSWWTPILDGARVTPLAANKKTPTSPEYLFFVVRSEGGGDLVSTETGNVLDRSTIQAFMPADKPEYANQGLAEEDKVRIRCYKLENILQLMVNGEMYFVTDNVSEYSTAAKGRLLQIAADYMTGERTMHLAGIK